MHGPHAWTTSKPLILSITFITSEMAITNPLEQIPSTSPNISSQIFHIAGILTVVHGLNELPQTCKSVSCLWLHHPRLQRKEVMANFACSCITDWNTRSSDSGTGLITVSFDQRNHGSREVAALSNESWRKGNARHAMDMFSMVHGTTLDTSLLIDHLGSYVFPESDGPEITQHLVLGISMGGHSAWQLLATDKRVTAGVVVIGCPDYMNLSSRRAQRSKLPTAGPEFIGSVDFPQSLIASVQKQDPKAIFFGTGEIITNPSESQQKELRATLDSRFKNKRILICSGSDDKLVPYCCSEPFLKFLKNAGEGWYADGNIYVEDKIYVGVGHAFSDDMLQDSVRFINETVAVYAGKPASKI